MLEGAGGGGRARETRLQPFPTGSESSIASALRISPDKGVGAQKARPSPSHSGRRGRASFPTGSRPDRDLRRLRSRRNRDLRGLRSGFPTQKSGRKSRARPRSGAPIPMESGSAKTPVPMESGSAKTPVPTESGSAKTPMASGPTRPSPDQIGISAASDRNSRRGGQDANRREWLARCGRTIRLLVEINISSSFLTSSRRFIRRRPALPPCECRGPRPTRYRPANLSDS